MVLAPGDEPPRSPWGARSVRPRPPEPRVRSRACSPGSWTRHGSRDRRGRRHADSQTAGAPRAPPRAPEAPVDAVALQDGDRFRPLPLVLRVTPAAAAAHALLHDGERRLRALPQALRTAVVDEPTWRGLDPDGATLADVDVPEDLCGRARGSGQVSDVSPIRSAWRRRRDLGRLRRLRAAGSRRRVPGPRRRLAGGARAPSVGVPRRCRLAVARPRVRAARSLLDRRRGHGDRLLPAVRPVGRAGAGRPVGGRRPGDRATTSSSRTCTPTMRGGRSGRTAPRASRTPGITRTPPTGRTSRGPTTSSDVRGSWRDEPARRRGPRVAGGGGPRDRPRRAPAPHARAHARPPQRAAATTPCC